MPLDVGAAFSFLNELGSIDVALFALSRPKNEKLNNCQVRRSHSHAALFDIQALRISGIPSDSES